MCCGSGRRHGAPKAVRWKGLRGGLVSAVLVKELWGRCFLERAINTVRVQKKLDFARLIQTVNAGGICRRICERSAAR
jgi:hypothetical protein